MEDPCSCHGRHDAVVHCCSEQRVQLVLFPLVKRLCPPPAFPPLLYLFALVLLQLLKGDTQFLKTHADF